ncbi:MAG: hypothetical protein E7473_10275 [Ruminococcaceae bacterium]|nr:hypothetical protein [Oscillospiraceae bacterium]MBQ7120517.1 hypothetical protein [Oscillospiraceae bacterium]
MEAAQILETIMIISFGASWPANVMKSWKARTTKGKSLLFLCLIEFGYIAGIASKFLNDKAFADEWLTVIFYILNFVMVGADLVLYYRNYRLDKAAAAQGK